MKKTLLSSLGVLAGLAAAHLALRGLSPSLAAGSLRNFGSGLLSIGSILPAVLLLIGLFDVWVPRAFIERSLGPGSGLRGMALAVLLGTAAAGPLYVAFPMGLALLRKGARMANLVVFLGAWATLKLPMLMMEGAFIGLRFALIRFALTLPGILACGWIMERFGGIPRPEAPELEAQP